MECLSPSWSVSKASHLILGAIAEANMKPGLLPCLYLSLFLMLLPVYVWCLMEHSEHELEYSADLTMDEEELEEENLEREGYQEEQVYNKERQSNHVRRSLRDPTDTDTSGSVDNEDISSNVTEHKVR